METTTTQPMMTNPMTTQTMMETTTTQPMVTEADETIIESYQELINKQEENDMKEARILASNNKKRNNMNKRMNNQNNRNEINDNNNRGNFKNIMAEDIMEETIEEETTEEETTEEEEEVVEEEFEGFANIKEGFTGSVIIKNNNTRLLLLTILITILAYLFCHQITKKFIVSNIKSLDKLLKTGGILQDNYTLIHMLLFGVLVFILFKLL